MRSRNFLCGDAALKRFLVRFALQAQQANSSQTYVGVSGTNIIGFYTLVVGEVRHSDAPARLVKGMPRHPIPLMVLARLAVETQWRGGESARGCYSTRWGARFRSQISQACEHSRFTPRTRLLRPFTDISVLRRRPPLFGISSMLVTDMRLAAKP